MVMGTQLFDRAKAAGYRVEKPVGAGGMGRRFRGMARFPQKGRELIGAGVTGASIPLTGNDILTTTATVRRLIAFNHVLDGGELKAGLKKSLHLFPVLAGRLKQDDDNKPFIALNDQGLLFEVVDLDEEIPAFGKTSLLKSRARELSVRLSLNPTNKDVPIAGIRVTRFRDGTVVSFSSAHVLCDGTSAWMFMNNWSECVRYGESAIMPDLDRTQLIRLGEESNDKEGYFENRFIQLDGWQRTKLYGKVLIDYLGTRNIVYHVPEDYLKRRKRDVMRQLRDGEWVSTQDVAAALIVDCLNHVLPGDSGEITNFYNLRGVDGLQLKKTYFGNAVIGRTWSETREPGQLARIALNLRRRQNAITRDNVGADLGFLERERQKGTAHSLVQSSLRSSFRHGILINNYSRFPIYSVDFGKGPPAWSDYPPLPIQQLAIINPHQQGDGIVVHLCLKRRFMKRLLRLPGGIRHFDSWLEA
jgi:shikimate O-hydroxycinnamoyltransferase